MSNGTGNEPTADLLDKPGSLGLGCWFALQLLALVVAICWFWPRVLPSPAAEPVVPPITTAPPPVADLVATDLVDEGKKLLGLLKTSAEGLPKYVLTTPISVDFTKSVTDFDPNTAPPAALKAELLKRLNAALKDPELSTKADPAVAKKVVDPKDPQPNGEALRKRNRALLEASFPGSLVASAPATPTVPPSPNPPNSTPYQPNEQDLLVVVLLFGALGGACSATWITTAFIGGRRMKESWALWHLLRAPIGGALAGIYYCVARGGILAADTPMEKINVFFIAGTAGLVGLFTKAAMQRLQTAFGDKPPPAQGDPDDAITLPVIVKVDPTPLSQTAIDSTVTLSGKGFPKNPEVQVDGVKQTVTSATATEIKFTLDSQQKAAVGAKAVIVITRTKDGEARSKPATLTVI